MALRGMGPLGAALTQPIVPAPTAPPQSDPSMWANFMKKMEQDPNFRQALLTTGLTMLGDPAPGESGIGTFSRAALTGVQTLDQLRARDREEGRRNEQLGIQQQGADARDESNRIADRRTDLAEDRNAQAASQFQESLAENIRQFDARLAAGDFDSSAGSTGAVNARIDANMEALVTSGRFPDTPEGRAEARLFAQGITTGTDPATMLRLATAEIDRRRQMNIFSDDPLTEAELVQQVYGDIQTMSDMINQSNIPQPQDEFDGQTIAQGSLTGTVVKKADGTYGIDLGDGQGPKGSFTADQIRASIESANAAGN